MNILEINPLSPIYLLYKVEIFLAPKINWERNILFHVSLF